MKTFPPRLITNYAGSAHPSALWTRVLIAVLTSVATAGVGCEDSSPAEPGLSSRTGRAAFGQPPQNDALGEVRNRADQAFAEMEEGFARTETRVGPQPWPADLPKSWPQPAAATVVADTRQPGGTRLLLINLPGATDLALDRYKEALEENGYRVDTTQGARRNPALRARNADHAAILTFVAREKVTRIEILFLNGTAG